MNTYTNPIKKHGDFADPFVLRYNGTYYLYCTNPGVLCWSSRDLINWESEGAVVPEEEFPGLVPFAPEVYAWNGAFYMYTSPHGFGHYVLKSDSPTGPFRKISDNFGNNIDGSVFIDDDGTWYFYYAHDDGIMVCVMPTPDTFGESINTGAFLHGWTEGPMVVKEQGKYYMTYTGNHFLSKGYRVQAAVSDRPQGPFRDCAYNPILVQTAGNVVGLGHNSIALGPDMQTRYLVYHNLNPDRTRDLNLDVVELLDGNVTVSGPSTGVQPVPGLPDWVAENEDDWIFDRGSCCREADLLRTLEGDFCCHSAKGLPGAGVLEFNLHGSGSRYGVTFGALKLAIERKTRMLYLENAEGTVLAGKMLFENYSHETIHCLRVHLEDELVWVELDGLKALSWHGRWDGDAVPGYFTENGSMVIGYTAFCGKREANSQMYFPIPCNVRLGSGELGFSAPRAGRYRLCVLADSVAAEDVCLKLEGMHGVQILTPNAMSADMAAYEIQLPEGLSRWQAHFGSGVKMPRYLFVSEFSQEAEKTAEAALPGSCGKRMLLGDRDVSFTASMEFTGDYEGTLGLMLRSSQTALGGEDDDEKLGINFFLGYCAGISGGRLVLTKHRYDQTLLASGSPLQPGAQTHTITAEVNLNDIRVILDGDRENCLTYHDREPIMIGGLGVRWIKGDRTLDCVPVVHVK